METIRTAYLGELRTKAEHFKSGNTLITDAPIDNKGRGETFSPTDLVAAALGSCMLTIIGIAANEHHFNIDGSWVSITKVMVSEPRRIGKIILDFNFPRKDYSDREKMIIEKAALTCPVAKSLHPELKQTVHFNF